MLLGFAVQRSGPGDAILLAPDLAKIRLAHHVIETCPEHVLSTACGDAGGIDKARDKSNGPWYLQQLVIMVGFEDWLLKHDAGAAFGGAGIIR